MYCFFAVACIVVSACTNPITSTGFGRVIVDLGGSGRGTSYPAAIQSVDIAVTAADMADIAATLSVSDLSVTLEVPAGSARTFDVLAKNSDGAVLYKGRSVIDIIAGETRSLSVSMTAVYVLSYNVNGGTGTVPSTSYHDAGDSVTVSAGPSGMSRAGYSFSGWNTAANGSGTAYAAGQTLAMPSSNMILYAQWQLIVYTLTYNLNGGSSHSNPSSYSVESASITLSPASWGVNIFLGWFTDAACTIPISVIATGSTGNLTLYAKWNVPSFNVTYDKNAGSATGSMSVQSIPNGASAPLTLNAYVRPGYTFEGWGTAMGGPVVYTDGASYTMGGAHVTLYAQWTANVYTVTYDTQGGSAAMPPSALVTYGLTYTSPPGTSRPGYTFGGWFTGPNGTGTLVNGSTVVVTPSDHAIFAYWIINQYTVTYDPNGATLGGAPASQVSDYGTTVTVQNNTGSMVGPILQDGIRQRFTGWNTLPSGLGTPYAGGSPLTLGAANVVLYAQYTYDLSVIDKIGPAGGYVFYDKGSVTNGWRYLEVAPANQAFSTWSNVTDTLVSGTDTAIGSGPFNAVQIMNQAGHATSAAMTCDAYSKTYDSVVYDDWFLPSKDELVTLHSALASYFISADSYWSSSDYVSVSAWNPARDLPNSYSLKINSYNVRAVRAFSTGAPAYVIVYLPNGADVGTAPTDGTRYAAASGIVLAGDNGMTMLGSSPISWNTAANGSGVDYPISGASTMPAGNLVLYAKW